MNIPHAKDLMKLPRPPQISPKWIEWRDYDKVSNDDIRLSMEGTLPDESILDGEGSIQRKSLAGILEIVKSEGMSVNTLKFRVTERYIEDAWFVIPLDAFKSEEIASNSLRLLCLKIMDYMLVLHTNVSIAAIFKRYVWYSETHINVPICISDFSPFKRICHVEDDPPPIGIISIALSKNNMGPGFKDITLEYKPSQPHGKKFSRKVTVPIFTQIFTSGGILRNCHETSILIEAMYPIHIPLSERIERIVIKSEHNIYHYSLDDLVAVRQKDGKILAFILPTPWVPVTNIKKFKRRIMYPDTEMDVKYSAETPWESLVKKFPPNLLVSINIYSKMKGIQKYCVTLISSWKILTIGRNK